MIQKGLSEEEIHSLIKASDSENKLNVLED